MRGKTMYSRLVSAVALLVVALTLSGSALAMSAKPLITSFTPLVGKTGTKITLTGDNLTGATSVKIGAVKAMFNVDSATKLTVTVPSKVKSGKITVTTKAGTATSARSFKA